MGNQPNETRKSTLTKYEYVQQLNDDIFGRITVYRKK
jgi:hypothetical protein